MNKHQLRKLAKTASGGRIKWIENNIGGSRQLNLETNKFEWVPFTDSSIWSKWMVGIEHKYQGCCVYMWFRIYNQGNEGLYFILEHIWKPGPGKKMRKDAEWNLFYKLMKKAGNYEK
jgi:hypothetical protein